MTGSLPVTRIVPCYGSVPPETPIRDIVDRCRVWPDGTSLKRRLPAIPTQAPPPLSAPTDLKMIVKRLLPTIPAQAPPPCSAPRNTDTDAATPSGDSPQGLIYCVSPVAFTAMISPHLTAERLRAGNGD